MTTNRITGSLAPPRDRPATRALAPWPIVRRNAWQEGTVMWQLYHSLLRTANGWDTHEWMIVFGIVVAIGVFALRGFGSRSHY